MGFKLRLRLGLVLGLGLGPVRVRVRVSTLDGELLHQRRGVDGREGNERRRGTAGEREVRTPSRASWICL